MLQLKPIDTNYVIMAQMKNLTAGCAENGHTCSKTPDAVHSAILMNVPASKYIYINQQAYHIDELNESQSEGHLNLLRHVLHGSEGRG